MQRGALSAGHTANQDILVLNTVQCVRLSSLEGTFFGFVKKILRHKHNNLVTYIGCMR